MLAALAFATLTQVWVYRTESEVCDVRVDSDLALVGAMQGVAAVDLSTGKPRWTKALGSGQFGCRIGASNGVIYVSVADGPFRALDRAGTSLWSIPRKQVAPAMLAAPDRLIFGIPDGKTTRLDPTTRKTAWTIQSGQLSCSPLALGQADVLGNRDGEAIAIGPDGVQLWRTNVGDSPVVGLAADDERVYVSTARGLIAGIGRGSGSVVWTRDVLNALTPGLLLQEGRLYATSSGGYAICVTTLQGQPLWSTPLSTRQDFGISPPAIAGRFVMTMQRNRMVGLDDRGSIAWEALSAESASAMAPIKLPADYLLVGSHALFRVRPQ